MNPEETADIWDAAMFEPHIGREFQVDGWQHRLVLRQVERSTGMPGFRPPFLAVFEGPAGEILAEGTHRLHLSTGFDRQMYLMPVATQSRQRQDYQFFCN